jgi:beta-glucosidase
MNKRVFLSSVAMFLVALSAVAQQPIYLEPSQPLDKRVDDLIPRLTLAEKISLLSTTAPAISRLKIPVMNGHNQSLHGIVWTKPTTMFPVPISMAATWDSQLVNDAAAAIADEGRAINNYWPTVQGRIEPEFTWPDIPWKGQPLTITANGERVRHNGLVYRSPVINISRSPFWGRIWESFGEDPWLDSRMTVAYIKGTQGNDPKYLKLAATPKHYAVNNQERDRSRTDVTVPEEMLREYYLPHFRAAIVEGKSASIMSSYNSLNGSPNAENKFLLQDVLRNEWKFDGFTVPDSGAVEDLVTTYHKYATEEEAAAAALRAGTDLDWGAYARALPKAVAQGLVTEGDINRALRNVMKVRFQLGEFDPPEMVPYTKIPPSVIDSPEHRQLALRLARESIVLLKNENGFLPLDKSRLKTIAVIGPFADVTQTGAGYTGLYSKFVKNLEGVKSKVGANVQVLYARGSGILESDNPEASYVQAEAAAKKADAVLLFVGINELLEHEGLDREFLNLPAVQLELVKRVLRANPKTAIILQNGGPVSLIPPQPAAQQEPDAPAILDMFWAGEEGGTAIADILFGDYNPGGKLPYTVYRSSSQVPPMSEYDIRKGYTYMYLNGTPEWAFGLGLSYTSFGYSNLRISPDQVPTGALQVNVDVQNTGNREGDEVVQLYIHDLEASVERPKKQLLGFQRINLKPGEKKTVSFSVASDRMAFWNVSKKAWDLEPGTIDVLVGSSSEEIRLRGQFKVSIPGQWTESGQLSPGT